MNMAIFKNLFLLICILIAISELTMTEGPTSNNERKGNPESDLLKKLLNNYDKNIRPGPPTEATVLTINIYIRLLNYFDGVEDDEGSSMSASLTFRESWTDGRLKFSDDSIKYVHPPNDVNIWFPDTFMQNEFDSTPIVRDEHDRLVRFDKDGNVMMSQRLQHRFHCPTDLYWYPFERAVCFMDIASYRYKESEIKLEWKAENPIQLSKHINMPQFTLKEIKTTVCSSNTNNARYGCLRAKLYLARSSGGKHLFELFFCPGMLVALSWIGFLLTNWRKDGIGLMVMIFLVFVVIVGQAYSNFPQARYSFVHTWISGCGYFIVVELVFLVILKLAQDFYFSQHPASSTPYPFRQTDDRGPSGHHYEMGEGVDGMGVENGGGLFAGNDGKEHRFDRWAKARMLGLIIFFLAFLIFAIVIRAGIPDITEMFSDDEELDL